MLDLIGFILLIFCTLSWIAFVVFVLSGFSSYEDDRWTPSLIALVVSLILSLGCWFIGVKVNIKNDIASITAYEHYKKTYPADKIIDTEIEQEYISSIQRLEYYKSIGLYNGDIIKEINEKAYKEFMDGLSGTDKDFVKKNAKRISDKLTDDMIKNGTENNFVLEESLENEKYPNLDELIDKYGLDGIVKNQRGKLYKEKFFVEVSPGQYKEWDK